MKKAESLVEVIMAIFVVAVGSAVSTSLIISALQSNEYSKDNLVALNLAVEGIEAVRAIRDANWLKFSFDKVNCWNMRPEVNDCEGNPTKTIAQGDYTVDFDLSPNRYGWSLPSTPVSSDLDLDNTTAGANDPYLLEYYDIDTSKDSDGDGKIDNDHDIIATKGLAPLPTGVAPTGDTRFYRMVQIRYPSSNPEMDVISTVQWRSQGVKHEVVLSTRLTDYQKVKVK